MKRTAVAILPVLACAVAVPASAQEPFTNALTIQVSNPDGSAMLRFFTDFSVWDPVTQTLSWTFDGAYPMRDLQTQATIATLLHCEYVLTYVPRANASLVLRIQGGAQETLVTAESPQLFFAPTLVPPQVSMRSFADIRLSDTNCDGFSRALAANGGVVAAEYNGAGLNGAVFTEAIFQAVVDAGTPVCAGSIDVDQPIPTIGFCQPGDFCEVTGDVSDISLYLAFLLTAGDIADVSAFTETTAPVFCMGDTNGDRIVTLDDLTIVLLSFGTTAGSPGFDASADVNDDTTVDLSDLAVMLETFGGQCF